MKGMKIEEISLYYVSNYPFLMLYVSQGAKKEL
jgi:hypothetical protein